MVAQTWKTAGVLVVSIAALACNRAASEGQQPEDAGRTPRAPAAVPGQDPEVDDASDGTPGTSPTDVADPAGSSGVRAEQDAAAAGAAAVHPDGGGVPSLDGGAQLPPAEAGVGGGDAGAPRIFGLEVEGGFSPLKPAFDAKTFRYSVLADSPRRDLELTATVNDRTTLQVDGQEVASGETVVLSDAMPGEEFSIVVSNGAGAATYTVSYLPSSFPDVEVTIDEPEASDDPIYVAMRLGSFYYLAKLNNDGVPLFYRAEDRAIFDFKKHPGGQLSYAKWNEERTNTEHVLLDAEFQEVARVQAVGLQRTDEHEFRILPNGNSIFLSYEPAERDLTEFGRAADHLVEDAVVQEVSAEGDVLFQWNSWGQLPWDHSFYGERDYAHVNSVFVDTDGNWILSSRGLSQVFKIDRSTGEILWRFGGILNEFAYENDPFENLCGQHTVTRVENGNLLIFDNGQYCWPEVSERVEHTRIVEYRLDVDARVAELVWSYHRDGAYCDSQGSAQRLPNGNTLIGWGRGPEMMTTEVTSDGREVFEMEAKAAGGVGTFVSYRVWRVPD